MARGITHVIVDEGVIELDLWDANLPVIVGVVESHSVGKDKILDRSDVKLNLSIDLLGLGLVIVVLESPVWVCDSVWRQICLWSVERDRKVFHVHQRNVTRELI